MYIHVSTCTVHVAAHLHVHVHVCKCPFTGELIPGSAGHTLLSSLSSNLFDV